ncbi:MAG: hypothetical protein E2P00_05355 [Acidobacteria bacterium]|nr:MAG: hypothetical protein E2P00_05355 [Acidobacteriota bacterium]
MKNDNAEAARNEARPQDGPVSVSVSVSAVSRAEAAAVTSLVLIILAVGVWACLGPEERLAYLLYDDAYYYLGVARNLAAGAGSTFDGINATNGYHPLWCWLLVPVIALARSPGAGVRAIGLLWYGMAAASAVALWWTLRRRSGAAGAVMAAALFGLHPLIALNLSRPNGLETPLYALLLALFLGVWERIHRQPSYFPGRRRMLLAGLLLGTVILSRLDAGMLALAAAFLLMAGGLRRGGMRTALVRVTVLAVGASVLVVPVLAWNAWRFGSPMPISERAVQVYAEEVRQELGGVGDSRYWRRRAWHALESVPLQMAREATGGTAVLRPLWRQGKVAGIAVLLLLVIGTAAAMRRRARGRDILGDALTLLALACALHYTAYMLWFWAGSERGFRLYYFMPESMLAAGVAGTLAGGLLDRIVRRTLWRRTLATAGIACLALFLVSVTATRFDQTRDEPGPLAERRLYGWIRHNLPEDAVLATTDAGRLGYFCGRPVVNLDGLINDQHFLVALRDKKVAAYVHDSPITHLVAGVGALHGYDPERPEIPPAWPDPVGSLLYEIGRLPGCRLRQVGQVENWLVFEILRSSHGTEEEGGAEEAQSVGKSTGRRTTS